jgi:hypothetical protein
VRVARRVRRRLGGDLRLGITGLARRGGFYSAGAVGRCMCVFITAEPIKKLFAWGEGDSGGHVIQETTSRGLLLVCPSCTSKRGGEGNCV